MFFFKNNTTLGKTYCVKIRLCIGALLSLGIAVAILRALVPVYDPEANLKKLDYMDGTITLQIELTNSNRFRGFKYSPDGWVELFYKAGDGTTRELGYNYITDEYQGFGKTLLWDFTIYATIDDPAEIESLKNQKSNIYVSLYLTYWFKIMSWTTKTNYYQWLEVNAELTDTLSLKNVSPFNRILDLTTAISS